MRHSGTAGRPAPLLGHTSFHCRLQLCSRAVGSARFSLFLARVDLTPAGNSNAWEWDPVKVASGPVTPPPPATGARVVSTSYPTSSQLSLGLKLPRKGSFCTLLGHQLCTSRPVFSWLALLQSENHPVTLLHPKPRSEQFPLLFSCVRTRWGGWWDWDLEPSRLPSQPPLSQPLRALPLCHFSPLLHSSAELGAQGRKEL